ncbi:MAG: hypothetical protein WA445_25440, partial [Pseudolabrys sp.]
WRQAVATRLAAFLVRWAAGTAGVLAAFALSNSSHFPQDTASYLSGMRSAKRDVCFTLNSGHPWWPTR